jgi:hypothetical protein
VYVLVKRERERDHTVIVEDVRRKQESRRKKKNRGCVDQDYSTIMVFGFQMRHGKNVAMDFDRKEEKNPSSHFNVRKREKCVMCVCLGCVVTSL